METKKTRKRYIKFNECEWSIFDHRYNLLDDALGECLEQTTEGDPDYAHWPKDWKGAMTISEDFYNIKTKKVKKNIPSYWNEKRWKNWVVRMDVTEINEIDKWIMDDCVDGNTFFANIEEYGWAYRQWLDQGKPEDENRSFVFTWSPKELKQAGRSIVRKFKRVGIKTRFYDL